MNSRLFTLVFISFFFIFATIDLDNLYEYNNQSIPDYITKDNTPPNNTIRNEGATLGRVLFYDKRLSANNTISCGSCHLQEFAFSDTAQLSLGLNGGLTGRHAMRLVNSRFSNEVRFFWDERATSLEDQSTRPIQDHVEMGFSGADGDPDINSLLSKLSEIEEYQRLFEFVYGDDAITEGRMQRALAQFIRSIQSFDSPFDEGLAMVNNINDDFPNYSMQENRGKRLFLMPPAGPNAGGAGCNGCHRAPEFDIAPNSMNNGVIAVAGEPNATDLTNTKAPSLRDLVNPDGQLNGPMMHSGTFHTLREVIDHYNDITFDSLVNPLLDPRLIGPPGGGGQGQKLNLTEGQKQALEAFLLTLTGTNIYTNPMYSDPFEPDGTIEILPVITALEDLATTDFIQIYPNPSSEFVYLKGLDATNYLIKIVDSTGKLLLVKEVNQEDNSIDIRGLQNGIHFILIFNEGSLEHRGKVLKL